MPASTNPIDDVPTGTGGTGTGTGGGGTGGGGSTTPPGSFSAAGDGYEVYLFDKNGLPKDLPQKQRGAATWQIKRKGGYDTFSLPGCTGVDLDLQQDDRIDIWARNTFQYRGYVSEILLAQGEQLTATLSGYGRSFAVGKIPITQKRLPYIKYVDISLVVLDLLTGWILPEHPDLDVEVQTAGYMVQSIDTNGKTIAHVMDALCDLCGGRAVWGCDVNLETGKDRFYFWREGDRAAADYELPVPSNSISTGQATLSSADIVNEGTFVGGDAEFPNRVVNPSFENPVWPWDALGEANMLPEPSFEQEETYPNSAEFFGGANRDVAAGTIKPFEGGWMLKTEDVNQGARWLVSGPFAAGEHLGLSFYAHPMPDVDPDHVPKATVDLFWQKPDGSEVVDVTNFVLQPVVQQWSQYTNQNGTLFVAPPEGAVSCRLEIKHIVGYGGNKGIVWDNFSLFRADFLRQTNWFTDAHNTARVVSVDYAHRDAKHGDLSVKIDVESSNTVDEDIHFKPFKPITVTGGEVLRFSGWFKNGISASGAVGGKLGLQWQFLIPNEPDFFHMETFLDTSVALGDFVYLAGEIGVPRKATQLFPIVDFLSDGCWIIDALSIRSAQAPGGADAPYVPDGPLSSYFRAVDLVTEAEDAEVHNSAATYGKRLPPGGTISGEGITTDAQLKAFAKGYFLPSAGLDRRPPITVQNDPRRFWPGQTVLLVGDNGVYLMGGQTQGEILPALPIDKVRGSITNDTLSHALDIGAEDPQLESIIRDAVTGKI